MSKPMPGGLSESTTVTPRVRSVLNAPMNSIDDQVYPRTAIAFGGVTQNESVDLKYVFATAEKPYNIALTCPTQANSGKVTALVELLS